LRDRYGRVIWSYNLRYAPQPFRCR
jgi:hypothetical protein